MFMKTAVGSKNPQNAVAMTRDAYSQMKNAPIEMYVTSMDTKLLFRPRID